MATNRDERPTFYEEQYLGADDLNSAIGYGRAQLARHSLGGHTWGIAVGLELVEKDVPGMSGQVDVFLSPGYAWDGFGRMISATSPSKLPPELFMNIRYDPAVDAGGKGRKIDVWLRYQEDNTQAEGEAYAPCDTEGRALRAIENFQFVIGSQSASQDQVLVNGQLVDAEIAVQKFNPSGSLLKDHTVAFQDWPPDEVKARWLIPLGCVLWQPVQGGPGFFVLPEDQTKSDIEAYTKTFRRYVGVVAGQIEATAGIIRLHDRNKAYSTDFSDELVWVEGNLRADGDIRPFGTALDFRDSKGKRNIDAEMLVRRFDDTGNSSALQLVIGHGKTGKNSLSIGPLDSDAFQPKLTVLDNGNVGVGTVQPNSKLEVNDGDLVLKAAGEDAGDLVFQNSAGTQKGRVWSDPGTSAALHLSSNDMTPDLTIDAAGNVGIGIQSPKAKLQILGGAIMPAVGNSRTAGIQFPSDPGGGAGDEAFIRYFVESGETTKLLIGIGNDEDDTIGFQQLGSQIMTIRNGNVGIGTLDPKARLHISNGAITPALGNVRNAGIQFPSDPGGGAGDEAFIRYFVQGGENTKLLIGVGNDADDTIGFQQAGAEQMTIRNGNVGIGTTDPQAKLQVVGGAIMPAVGNTANAGIQFPSDPGGGAGDEAFIRYFVQGGENTKLLIGVGNDADDTIGFQQAGAEQMTIRNGSVGIGTMTPDPNYKLDVAGEAISPNFFSTSDARLKKNIAPLTDVLERLSNVNGVSYQWNETYEALGRASKKREIGIIAQDVQRVFPELVSTWNAENYLAVDYGRLTAVLVEAVKELNTKIEALQERVSKLETQPRPTQRKTKDNIQGRKKAHESK